MNIYYWKHLLELSKQEHFKCFLIWKLSEFKPIMETLMNKSRHFTRTNKQQTHLGFPVEEIVGCFCAIFPPEFVVRPTRHSSAKSPRAFWFRKFSSCSAFWSNLELSCESSVRPTLCSVLSSLISNVHCCSLWEHSRLYISLTKILSFKYLNLT